MSQGRHEHSTDTTSSKTWYLGVISSCVVVKKEEKRPPSSSRPRDPASESYQPPRRDCRLVIHFPSGRNPSVPACLSLTWGLIRLNSYLKLTLSTLTDARIKCCTAVAAALMAVMFTFVQGPTRTLTNITFSALLNWSWHLRNTFPEKATCRVGNYKDKNRRTLPHLRLCFGLSC